MILQRIESPVSILKDTTDASATATLEEDMWNLELNDILDMPAASPLRRSLSSCASSRSMRIPRTNNAVSSKKHPPRRTVSFDKVKVRVFERALSDNPSCKAGGPSIGLGWNHSDKGDVAVDKFETKRIRRRRQNSKDMEALSPGKREKLAKKLGYSKEEIRKNVKRVEKTQQQRRNTSVLETGGNVSNHDPYAILEQARRSHGHP